MKRILFLDYDGVVNNVIWDKEGKRAQYASAAERKVNDFQAVQWVSEFCEKYDYQIVVTSTWRVWEFYKEALWNGGLRDGIIIADRTPILRDKTRGDEVAEWLREHPEVECYIIIDDENSFTEHKELEKHLVQCHSNQGFNLEEFIKAEQLHKSLYG